jgi:hypothetical protein
MIQRELFYHHSMVHRELFYHHSNSSLCIML